MVLIPIYEVEVIGIIISIYCLIQACFCSQCETYHPDRESNDETKRYCTECNRTFDNQTCFDRHATKAKRKSICNYVQLCVQRGVKFNWRNRTSKNVDGEHFCTLIADYVNETHVCYIKPSHHKRVENFLHVVFDIETMRLDKNDKGIMNIKLILFVSCNVAINVKIIMMTHIDAIFVLIMTAIGIFLFYSIEAYISHIFKQDPKFTKVVSWHIMLIYSTIYLLHVKYYNISI